MRVNPLYAFLFQLLLSLLSLMAAFWLHYEGKPGASHFLLVCVFAALLAAVIGTNGKVSLQAVSTAIRSFRSG